VIKQVNNNPFYTLEEVCSKVKIPKLEIDSDLEVIKLSKIMQQSEKKSFTPGDRNYLI